MPGGGERDPSDPVFDGLMAATAKVHDLTAVTSNEADVANLGARILNPYRPGDTEADP